MVDVFPDIFLKEYCSITPEKCELSRVVAQGGRMFSGDKRHQRRKGVVGTSCNVYFPNEPAATSARLLFPDLTSQGESALLAFGVSNQP